MKKADIAEIRYAMGRFESFLLAIAIGGAALGVVALLRYPWPSAAGIWFSSLVLFALSKTLAFGAALAGCLLPPREAPGASRLDS